ncbi:hypothetical protein L1887_05984 [Cichorium endivia]|nr:hypothetical protein L1887_05984 [Cichorium endivia]
MSTSLTLLNQGMQWPALMQALALRAGGPLAFRLTGIGPPQPDNTDVMPPCLISDQATSLFHTSDTDTSCQSLNNSNERKPRD